MVKARLSKMEFVLVDLVDNQMIRNDKGKVAKFRIKDADLESIAVAKLVEFMSELTWTDLEEIPDV
jgi:hypothetical protein